MWISFSLSYFMIWCFRYKQIYSVLQGTSCSHCTTSRLLEKRSCEEQLLCIIHTQKSQTFVKILYRCQFLPAITWNWVSFAWLSLTLSWLSQEMSPHILPASGRALPLLLPFSSPSFSAVCALLWFCCEWVTGSVSSKHQSLPVIRAFNTEHLCMWETLLCSRRSGNPCLFMGKEWCGIHLGALDSKCSRLCSKPANPRCISQDIWGVTRRLVLHLWWFHVNAIAIQEDSSLSPKSTINSFYLVKNLLSLCAFLVNLSWLLLEQELERCKR